MSRRWALDKRLSSFLLWRTWKKDARNSKQPSSIRLSSGEGKAWEENNRVNVFLVIGTHSSSLATSLRIKAETREKQGDVMGSGIITLTQTRSSVFLSCLSGLGRGEANTSSYFSNPSFCRKSSNSLISPYTVPQRFVSECLSPCRQSVAVHRLERNYAKRHSRYCLNSY